MHTTTFSLKAFHTLLLGSLLALVALIPSIASADEAPVEGRDYQVLRNIPSKHTTGEKVVVNEFFWYGCPACYQLEPFVARWKQANRDNVDFQMTAVPNPSPTNPWTKHARLYFTLKTLGVAEEAQASVFNLLHEVKNPMLTARASYEALSSRGVLNGISEESFVRTYESSVVTRQLAETRALVDKTGIAGTPAFLVDGRIIVRRTQRTANPQRFFEMLDQIVQLVETKAI